MNKYTQQIKTILWDRFHTLPEEATPKELYQAVSEAAMSQVVPRWETAGSGKRAAYFSAEFLIGRMISSNLLNLGLLDDLHAFLDQHGIDRNVFETISDPGLGNGGLGRLAACFLDSAATHGIPLDGYGIRYRYGLFEQFFVDGFQKEMADDWLRFGDPWSVRREADKVEVQFADQTVVAVPYDMPVIGYGESAVNTLRLWQAEPQCAFHFQLFNAGKYDAAVKERNDAENLTNVLYPNDDTPKGKRLRLKQQYFFTSASLKDLIRRFKFEHGTDFSQFPKFHAIQLNDTHPVVAVPEFLRLLTEEEQVDLPTAMELANQTFAYTNHTILPEALERWSVPLFRSVLPHVYRYVDALNRALKHDLKQAGIPQEDNPDYLIVSDGMIHMARLAVYATHSTNGVAAIHTQLLKQKTLHRWYQLYPERFQNQTNGITQRRWLALANPELSSLISDKIGDGWMTDLTHLKRLDAFASDPECIDRFIEIKKQKKEQLAAYIEKQEQVRIRPEMLFDVQVKRLHEYKRQLLNALSILDLYFGLKEGRIQEFAPTLFLFGAKAAPGYLRAKAIIKFIHEIAALIQGDTAVRDLMQVVFVHNYNVSYAEKIIPAADLSQQISLAGTEASGTGNMKLMLNGAVTLGTYDGANVEIVEQAGRENNYIFGLTVQEVEQLKPSYHPVELYQQQPRIRRVVDTLVDGTFSDCGTGMFRELYDSLLTGASWHAPDQYMLLADFLPYCDTRLKANLDSQNKEAFAQKCLHNIANAGIFSSDRTVLGYARDIWGIKSGPLRPNRME